MGLDQEVTINHCYNGLRVVRLAWGKVTFICFCSWILQARGALLPVDNNDPFNTKATSLPLAVTAEIPGGIHRPPEVSLKTPELIQHNGFPVETHKVPTADGYILTVFRIPGDGTDSGKGPVLLGHCFMCSSDDWLLILPKSEQCLPYLLAREGYDVWLINFRGNDYSQEHETLSVDSLQFWDFSFNEMGIYDIPAAVDYILMTTGAEQVSYVGHSMGTTTFFIAMIRHPDLQTKISRMVALAPEAYVSHAKSYATSPIRHFRDAPRLILWASRYLYGGRVASQEFLKWLNTEGPAICEIGERVCLTLVFFMVGFDLHEATRETLMMIVGHTPSQTSGKTMSHFAQYVQRPRFAEYDYGAQDNRIRYNRTTPPLYNLRNNRVPTFAFFGRNDLLLAKVDFDRTVTELGNVVSVHQVDDPLFNHLDFLYAKDAKSLVYDHIINSLARDI